MSSPTSEHKHFQVSKTILRLTLEEILPTKHQLFDLQPIPQCAHLTSLHHLPSPYREFCNHLDTAFDKCRSNNNTRYQQRQFQQLLQGATNLEIISKTEYAYIAYIPVLSRLDTLGTGTFFLLLSTYSKHTSIKLSNRKISVFRSNISINTTTAYTALILYCYLYTFVDFF